MRNLKIYTIRLILLLRSNQEDEMGWTYSMHDKLQMRTRFLSGDIVEKAAL
jgi:hypothetical protein